MMHEQGTASSASQGSRAVAGVQGHPTYAPGLMIADYGGGQSAGASDEAPGPGKKRKKGDEAQSVSDVHSLSPRYPRQLEPATPRDSSLGDVLAVLLCVCMLVRVQEKHW